MGIKTVTDRSSVARTQPTALHGCSVLQHMLQRLFCTIGIPLDAGSTAHNNQITTVLQLHSSIHPGSDWCLSVLVSRKQLAASCIHIYVHDNIMYSVLLMRCGAVIVLCRAEGVHHEQLLSATQHLQQPRLLILASMILCPCSKVPSHGAAITVQCAGRSE